MFGLMLWGYSLWGAVYEVISCDESSKKKWILGVFDSFGIVVKGRDKKYEKET